jgi:hypothetical protein
MANSVGTTFYIETQIDLSVLGCGNSPKLLVPPIDRACTGVAFYHNPGAYDIDGDSLSYELVVPFRDRNTEVTAYRNPDDPSFYPNYETGNETGTGPPTFTVDQRDGTIVWNAPSLPQGINYGEFNIAFIVKEWRYTEGEWTQIGYVRRDMQIIVENCENERPRLEIPLDLCVTAGTTITETIFGYDDTIYLHEDGTTRADNHPVKIEAFSEIFASTFPSPATFQPNPPVFQPSSPPAELLFNWNTTCEHVKDQPYQIVFKITDNPPQGPKLVTFETWNITVVAPPPVWGTPVVLGRQVELHWEEYECADEAFRMQIWRKVESSSFTPANCETGMPENLGFTLIAERPIAETTFTDNNGGTGLDVGAQYCYRLVAIFPQPRGGESYVSEEICVPPIEADAPIITNVTVDKTGEADGIITVRWVPPFDTDTVYVVQRAEGSGFINVSGTTPISDTFWIDANLNSRDLVYFYRVYYPANTMGADTVSALASSPALELKSQPEDIQLSWSATVPWSNQIESYPWHYIYRGAEGSTLNSDLVLIDSVNVLLDGLTYIDSGQYNNIDLEEGTVYCYQVMTQGGYGNPDIEEPIQNFSQINCAELGDDEPPCTPVIVSEGNTCDEAQPCSQTATYSNEITWKLPNGFCEDDIRSYVIYYSYSKGSDVYDSLTTVPRTQLSYVHMELSSRALCYKVKAVDRSGNMSGFSEPICFDNCPYYELPNVFTPGDGNNCNELFRAFGWNLGENPGCPPVDPTNERCARFVLKVVFTVFNRWGSSVYEYTGQIGDVENTIYLNWDGRDKNGNDLSSGVYYYLAEVTYDVVDPSRRNKELKGWVHIVRPGRTQREN